MSYNFGVLTRRYELVNKTAAQLAPGVVGVAVGFVLIVLGVPVPVPFAPALVGFWLAVGKVPFGAHRGTPVRTMVIPIVRYGLLALNARLAWEIPITWLSVAVDAVATNTLATNAVAANAVAANAVATNAVATTTSGGGPPIETAPTVEPGGHGPSRRVRGRRQKPGLAEQLPPELGRLRWRAVTCDGAEAGLVAERVGRGHLLTAVISVSGGDRFVFSGPNEQAAQIFAWGEVLKAMATSGPGLRRLQWVERATPQPATVQQDWSRAAMGGASDEEWADYQSLQDSIGTAAIHHDVYLGAQVETDASAAPEALAEAATELAQLCEHLRSIGLGPKALSRRGIAAVLRSWADPGASERVALWGEASIPLSQAGPASRRVGYDSLRTDGYFHRVGQIAAWPRIDVGSEWMYPLLASALPGSVRTVSMHLEAVSTGAALAEVRDARTTGGMAQAKRDRLGIITTEESERRVDEARSREAELTQGFRQHKVAGLVMVSSPDPEVATRAWRQVERKALECHLDLRQMPARGHEAWAATLPLCRLGFAKGLV